jgi:hypothetical protein
VAEEVLAIKVNLLQQLVVLVAVVEQAEILVEQAAIHHQLHHLKEMV